MQNKGLVKTIAVALVLICCFYLSFGFVTSHYNNKAAAMSEEEGMEYLDSIKNEKVYLGIYTLKQCQEMEIGLGLDLKGGMNVILEVSVPDVIDVLADHKQDAAYQKTLAEAKMDEQTSQDDFISLFINRWKQNAQGRSLADFVAPKAYGFDSPAGMFAISVHRVAGDSPVKPANDGMDYESMLDRSLRLTLAEAASGWLDAQLEKQLPKGSPVKIVKPAAGYASCPDHSLKRDILALLPGGKELDIQLTESCAMIPDASICGLIFAHPSASYPEIRRLSLAALDAYAALRGFTPEEATRFLSHLN